MKKFVFALCIALMATSCGTVKQIQIVEKVSRDTLYLSNVQYDSIYVYQGLEKDYRRDIHQPSTLNPQPIVDTVYVKDVQYEYKYKFLRDTVYKVQIDTIPVIREVEVVKTERYIPTIYKWSLAICIALIILIVLSIAKKFFL